MFSDAPSQVAQEVHPCLVPMVSIASSATVLSVSFPHFLTKCGGCEAAVHSARRYLQALSEDHVLVKLDISNAFNSLHRRDMVLSVHNRVPELYAYCWSAYNQPSFLFFGPYTVLSQDPRDPTRRPDWSTPFL